MDELHDTHWAPKLWGELRSKEPEKICERADATYDPSGFFEMKTLNVSVRVYPDEERIESEDELLAASPDFQLLVVSYLLYAKNIAPHGRWVSEKDLTGGSTFFRGPHALPSAALERLFGDDPDAFRERSLALGATPAEFGDVSMQFQILPRVSFILVLWVGDEEFPPRVTFMVDPSVDAHLPLDVLFAMISAVTKKLTGT